MMRYSKTPYELLSKRWPNIEVQDHKLQANVESIVEDVKTRGDKAVKEYTQHFDEVMIEEFRVSPEEFREAFNVVSSEQIKALNELKERLEIVERKRLNRLSFSLQFEGVDIECAVRPLDSVGCYVPGGKAAYPSSLVMNVIPAKVAGVKKVIICTPPGKDGRPSPLTLVAAKICDIEDVFKVGGVQAVASMAYGTESIPKVEKIVGPGNKYVTTAKQVVSNVVSIDKPAGPSEILILADNSADARLIALDLISQAEHGDDGAYGLVTTSTELVDRVNMALDEIINDLDDETLRARLNKNGFLYIVENLKEAIDFTNQFAPEHLEVLLEQPRDIVQKINSAGLILLGPYSPVSATDYSIGVNHVLPTGGYGKVASGITVLDYVRMLSVVDVTKDGLAKVEKSVNAISEAEGLPYHSLAVKGRFKG
jgi:histidinol dehydrogenase